MEQQSTVVEQIQALMGRLEADVNRTRTEYESAQSAMSSARAQFGQQKKSRKPAAAGEKRGRKPKTFTTAENDAAGVESVGDGTYTVIGCAKVYNTRAAAVAAAAKEK